MRVATSPWKTSLLYFHDETSQHPSELDGSRPWNGLAVLWSKILNSLLLDTLRFCILLAYVPYFEKTKGDLHEIDLLCVFIPSYRW
jgi:hypothetical protein